jgi:hypothetical protein
MLGSRNRHNSDRQGRAVAVSWIIKSFRVLSGEARTRRNQYGDRYGHNA